MLHDSSNSQEKWERKYSFSQEFKVPIKHYENIEVSVIIPSCNRYPLNLFTLYSLENQSFDPSKMEVIFIDDASDDQTEQNLKNYQPPFHFQYIRNEQNMGRAKVRNIGINAARGNILIFLDAEMLTAPDFIKNHYQYHQENENAVITGVMSSKNIITCLFSDEKSGGLYQIPQSIRNSTKFSKRLENFRKSDKSPYPLIDKNDIINQSYQDLIVETSTWFTIVWETFGGNLEGFQFPWMAFLTGNVSLRKELIIDAGLFDEDFKKYGYEDWELGYRLYKRGARFMNKADLAAYHQEHPVGESRWNEAIHNFNLFISKHPDVDVLILGLELSRFTGLLPMNRILYEYKMLIQEHPKEFLGFQEKFMDILRAVAELLLIDIRHFNVLGAAGFGTTRKKELLDDIERIKKLKEYPSLTSLLEKIIHT